MTRSPTKDSLPTGRQFAIGFCGGSGIVYGLRLVEVLLGAGHTVHLMATGADWLGAASGDRCAAAAQ